MTRENIYNLILFGLLFIPLYFIIRTLNEDKDLAIKNNRLIVTSMITKTESAGYRSGYLRLYVKFIWRNKIVSADFASPNTECNVIGKKILLVIDSNNVEDARMLLKPEDFLKFNLVFPDSLSWTKECFKLE